MKPRKIFTSSDFSGPRKFEKFSRKLGVLLLILFLILPTVLAIETNLKSIYQPSETLIAEISGNFIDNLKPENILFYSGRVFVPMIYDLAKIQDKYYLYAILPEKERNYTLIIKNVHYTEAGQEKQDDLQYNFSVLGNISSFSVNPGFIITNQDFNIKVEANKNINLATEFLNSTQETIVSEGQQKRIPFSVAGIKNFTFTYLILNADSTEYKIPVAVYKETEEIPEKKELKFSKSELNFTILEGKEFEFEISLLNTGPQDIEDILLSSDLTQISKITPNEIENLSTGNLEKINLTIKSDEEGIINGTLIASSGNYTAEVLISITTIKDEGDFQDIIKNNSEVINQGSCSELKGNICVGNQQCSGTTKITFDGLCCIGECKEKSSSSNTLISVIIILVILAIIGFFVYRKLKLKKSSSTEILKAKEKAFESRFKPTEIRGGLTRI